MFVLIWATLLLFVRGSNADTGTSVVERRVCQGDYCITLNEGEITAEAGLCVVIPCSFTTYYWFRPQHMVWFKCEPFKQRCGDSEMIFHSNQYNRKVQSGFKGRVSLLEPDRHQKNCSIIINDLTESDSGSYQFRVNGNINGRDDGFTFPRRATVYVKGLIQKPTVMFPPLTEGQETTLTCTAPGLCSGSAPEITWTWRGAGESDSHITGNITAVKTKYLTAVTQRHSSALTFNPSAEHHDTSVTCTVSFTNGIITEETVTLNVTYVKEVNITGTTSVMEGETLNLTCSLESFPPSVIKWTKFFDKNKQNGTETNLKNDTLTDLQNDTLTDLQNDTLTDLQNDTWTDLQNDTSTDLQNNTGPYLREESGMGILSILNVTAADSGQYICTAKYQNRTLMESVNVTVIYMREPVITGNKMVEDGNALNLTCSVESFPPSRITWTTPGSNKKMHNEPNNDLQSDTGSATLVIHNMATENSGQYICTAQHLNRTVTVYADVTVTLFPKISADSACEVQSEVLTCVCISEALPLPTIKWPLLKNHSEYSVITTVSNRTINSTVTLTVKDHSSTAVECVSSNENGEARENLTTHTGTSEKAGQLGDALKNIAWLEVILAFLIGVLLSAVICCLALKCHRKKTKSFGNLNETVEMVTSQEDPLIDAGQAVEDDQTYYQEAAEEGEGAVAAEKAVRDLDGGPKDVEYASIDFSVLKRKSPSEAAKKQETTETEYAEIKKAVKEEREDDGGEEGEVLESKEEGEMVEGDEETKQCVPEEEGEDGAVYSNVKDIMGEI